MSTTTQKTAWFSYLENLKSLNLPFELLPNSTLNEKFATSTNAELPTDEYPTLKYLAIGNGGHRNALLADSTPVTRQIYHSPTHPCLANHIPFILRPVTSDLTASEKNKYRMRVLLTINGTKYFAYYLKVVTVSSATPDMNIVTVTDGATAAPVAFVPSASDFEPTMSEVDPDETTANNSSTLVVESPITASLSAADVAEIRNAVEIISGDAAAAIISEAAFCTGFDVSVTSSLGGVTATYTEVGGCQVANFVSDLMYLASDSTTVSFNYTLSESMRL